jgi:hypothetical protein
MVLTALTLLACSGGSDDTPTTPTETADTAVDPFVEDVFPQNLREPLRIVFLMDPSWGEGVNAVEASMKKAMDDLLSANPEHQLAVLSADVSYPSAGVLKSGWIGWPVPADAFTFQTPGGPPHMREAVYAAFQLRIEANDEFFDEKSTLYVIGVSDKVDASSDSVVTEDGFIEWMDELETFADVRFSMITTSDRKSDYRKVVNQSDGVTFEVGSFETGVITLLRDAMNLQTVFTLSEPPREPPQEIEVVHREVPLEFDIDDDYVYNPNDNSVSFLDYVPPPGSTVRIRYERITGNTPTEPTDTDPTGGSER